MNTASINDIKKELQTQDFKRVLDLCLRLAKSNKQAKELLSYLLFEAHDETAFVESAKGQIHDLFLNIPSNFYFAKKHLRKILKEVNKFIKYSASPKVEIQLLLFFLATSKEFKVNFNAHPVTTNMMVSQVKKINKAILKLHEDLQYDYTIMLEDLLQEIGFRPPAK